jgi:hypothetical protein
LAKNKEFEGKQLLLEQLTVKNMDLQGAHPLLKRNGFGETDQACREKLLLEL